MDSLFNGQIDIFFHVGVSAVLAVFFLLSFKKLPRKQAVALTFVMVLGIGLGKEVFDTLSLAGVPNYFSIKDMLSNYAGVTLASLALT